MSPTKAKPTRKKPAKETPSDNATILRTEWVSVKSLQGYHKNPRRGDVDKIAESLAANGQYRAIVVNVGTHTGRKNEILAGNHTWLGARKLGLDTIYASFVDVDDDTAAKIVLADNKTADLGDYEDAILAELLGSIPTLEGTGFEQQEVDEILAGIDTDSAESLRTLSDFTKDMPDDYEEETNNRSARQRHIEEESEEKADAQAARGASRPEETEDDKDIEDIDVGAELQVILELKEDNIYKGNNAWGIPDLRTDMLCEELPSPIQTWGGHEATPDDGKTWWFYNYSLGGRKGLPIDRSIMAFNTHDRKFANWWEMPAYYVSRYMSEGLQYIVVPDFSFYYTETRTHHLWGVYKAQWMGRFFQEAGLKVIPRLQFDYTDPQSLEIALLGIPRGLPVLATSQQNIEDEKAQGPKVTAMLKEALEELQPKQFLYYSGNPGKRAMEATGWDGDVVYIENYAAVRRATVFDKKEGKAKLTKKQKDALIEKHGGKKKSKRDEDEEE